MRIGDTPDTVDELPARSVRHGRPAGLDIDAGYVTDVLVETPRRSATDAEVWGR